MRKNYTRVIDNKYSIDFKNFLDMYNYNYKTTTKKHLFKVVGVSYDILANEHEVAIIDYFIKTLTL